jgi:lambda family phage portal protein
MKNPIDFVVEIFNPKAALIRAQSRLALNVVEQNKRGYEAATSGRRNGSLFRPATSGAQEVSKAVNKLANAARELCRNNPLANRIPSIWANNAIGREVSLEAYNVDAKKQTENFNKDWDDWAESTDCDFEGHLNLGGLQWLWAHTIVESGGVFVRRHINSSKNLKFPLQLQTIEQDLLDRTKSGDDQNGSVTIDGIKYSAQGQIIGYWFFTEVTNTKLGKPPTSKFHKAANITHIFRKKRAGQHLGVTWLHSNTNTLENYETYKDAKLMQLQIAACFAVLFEEAEKATTTNEGTDGSRTMPDTIEPAMIEYIKSGTIPHTITPPKADNATDFDTGLKRDIAVGSGLTYEQLSGDYSKVNFASGRMGKNEFYQELDSVQYHTLKPAFDKIALWFYGIHTLKLGTPEVKFDWTFPPRATVNPQEEFAVLMSKVRHGMMSPRKACKILGERLEKVISEWEEDKALFKDLPFDIDPSKFAATGNQLDDNDSASSNNPKTGKEENKPDNNN